MLRPLTIKERSDFLYNVAQKILNQDGFLDILISFWSWIDSRGSVSHEIFDEIEKEIYQKSQLSKYQP